MDSQFNSLVLVLTVSLLACIKGDEYFVKVSQTETIDKYGMCYKNVAVSGNGVEDEVPVRCDMAAYVIANDKQLVVGDSMYSDKPGILVVVGFEGCEQRTYTNGVLTSATQLTADGCEEVKMAMMEAFLNEDEWKVDASDDSNDDLSFDWDDFNESQIKGYDDLGEKVEDNAQPDSTKKV